MKNPNRAKGDNKSPKANIQSETGPITVVLYSKEQDREIDQVELSAETSKQFINAAKSLSIGPGQFLSACLVDSVHFRKSGGLRDVPVQEHDGDWITTNYWIKLGLTYHQRAALARIGKRYKIKSPVATIARWMLSGALLHLERSIKEMEAMIKYIHAEGFKEIGPYCDPIMAAKNRATKN